MPVSASWVGVIIQFHLFGFRIPQHSYENSHLRAKQLITGVKSDVHFFYKDPHLFYTSGHKSCLCTHPSTRSFKMEAFFSIIVYQFEG